MVSVFFSPFLGTGVAEVRCVLLDLYLEAVLGLLHGVQKIEKTAASLAFLFIQ